MQLSEFRDLLANDGFAATFQTMGQYRTELLRALDKLRAQADARPVAIPTIEGAKLELHSDLHLKDLRLLGCHIITNGFKVHAHSQEAIESCVLVGAKLYTHPEASAPGLSEPAFWISKSDAAWLERVPGVNGQIQALRLGGASRVPVFLTRASAATVAEPSDVPQLHVGDSSFEGWYQDYAARLTGNPKQTARDAYAAGMGDPLVMPREAAQQQAEPGADERAEFETALKQYAEACHRSESCSAMDAARARVCAIFSRAAQSGQREDLEAELAEWKTYAKAMEDNVAELVDQWRGKLVGQRAGVADGFRLLSHERNLLLSIVMRLEAGNEKKAIHLEHGSARVIRGLLDRAAAPTQQQEGDDWQARALKAEALLNSPELHDFARAVPLEAAHQRSRWGTEHDAGKTPADWFWLIGYLAGKALHAQTGGNTDKALHHTISTAAALANWHAAISGADTSMRPGIAPPADTGECRSAHCECEPGKCGSGRVDKRGAA